MGLTVNPRKLEHGFRRILARIPYTLPEGHEDIDVPTFWGSQKIITARSILTGVVSDYKYRYVIYTPT